MQKNTFNVRPVLLNTLKARRSGTRLNGHQFRPTIAPSHASNGSSNGSSNGTSHGPCAGSGFGAARSLDLLRTNLQTAINKDIKQVLNKYLEVGAKGSKLSEIIGPTRETVNVPMKIYRIGEVPTLNAGRLLLFIKISTYIPHTII